MILFELRSKTVNGKKEFYIRVSYNKNLLDISGVCVIDGQDYYVCPYENFKTKINLEHVLAGDSD
jgi:hypothetical protein